MSEENIQSIIPPDGTPTISKSEDFVGDPEITELKGIQEKYVQQESETDNLIKLRDEYILHLVELQKKREQAEIEKGNPIQNLIDNAENLRLTQEKQIEQLRETEEEFNILSKRVEAINKLVAQNPIAPEVQKAIENHNQSLESLRSDHERLTNEIQSIELDLIPEELIDEYKENMETEKKLDYQVALIEDNPNVIKRLVEYAENEDKMRTIIIDSIANNCSNKLQRDIMSTAMQMFLTEQFELAGFNQIEEDKKRHEAMQNFTREVLSGINWDKSNGYPTKNEKIGLLLKNLTGQLGNFDDTIDFLREASGIESLIDNSSEQEQVSTAAVKQFIHAHIGTINYLRSVYKGAKNYRGKIFGEKSPNEIWERFDSRIKLYGFDIAENGGVIPKENLNDKEEIVIDYNEKLKKATELNEKLTSQEINDLKKTGRKNF